jgi:hypothetical protein
MKLKLCGLVLVAIVLSAEAPPATTSGPVASFTATTANVGGAPDSVRIDILRWSTNEERDRLMAAWAMKGGTAGRGDYSSPARAAGRGGRGSAAGRGGRGAAVTEDAPSPTPEGTLANALKETTTVGYLWSSEVAGYALRYAGKVTSADGSERVILITHRRLGAMNDLWKPAGGATPANYDFSVIELRVNAKGEGEGKASLTGKVVSDSAAKIVALEDYEALPVVLGHVKRRADEVVR